MSHAPASYAALTERPAYQFPTPEQQALFTEARLGQECGLWLQWYDRDAYDLFLHVPNGGLRTAREANALKGQHTKAGVPDYLLAMPKHNDAYWIGMIRIASSTVHGLFIELKTATGRVAPEQTAWHTRLRAQGYRCEVVRSLSEFIALLTEYLS